MTCIRQNKKCNRSYRCIIQGRAKHPFTPSNSRSSWNPNRRWSRTFKRPKSFPGYLYLSQLPKSCSTTPAKRSTERMPLNSSIKIWSRLPNLFWFCNGLDLNNTLKLMITRSQNWPRSTWWARAKNMGKARSSWPIWFMKKTLGLTTCCASLLWPSGSNSSSPSE